MDPLHEILLSVTRDRVLAHELFFKHRHPNQTAPFQREMITDWHDFEAKPWLLDMVFRGGAKSTIAEEAILLKSALAEIRNYLIIGSSLDRACERLAAIRHEVEQNEMLAEVFGDLRGPTWGDTELVLSNGVRLLALGKGQALRGVKYLEARPDGFFIDDIETRSDVRTPEARKATLDWVLTDLIPACDVTKAHGRCAATPLDPEALPYQLERAGWTVKRYPVEYLDEEGKRRPTWPDRVPLVEIDKIRSSFERTGSLREYNAEYMCTAEAAGEKTFRAEMIRVEAQVRTWQNVYGMFDPARTINRDSATTGFAAWSWIGPRMVVWSSWALQLMPDQIIKAIFQFNQEFNPTAIYLEEDGLNEFLLQPIRQEQTRRGIMIPYEAVKAPKGKLDFIRGLQPYFNAREIWFAKDLPDLKAQLLSFPTGKIDAPNALAYAPRLRPGAPIYDDFSGKHIAEDLSPASGRPAWLCLNATPSMVTAVLVQVLDGALRVYADWVREGDAGQVLSDVVKEAQAEAGKQVRLVAGAQHFETFTNVGLKQAAGRMSLDLRKGMPTITGQAVIRDMLRRDLRAMPALMVSREARWTANGFAGGYARALLKQGILADYAKEGAYRVLMEGIEAFAGLLKTGLASEDDDNAEIRYDTTANGRRFISARR
jgi:hypothetical protein